MNRTRKISFSAKCPSSDMIKYFQILTSYVKNQILIEISGSLMDLSRRESVKVDITLQRFARF